jgi:hypothetical protein
MNIYAISLIKNEADIVEYTLSKASEWADQIFVYDNGSVDGTWEKICYMSRVNKKIIPWKRHKKPFRDSLRAEVFNEFSHIAQEGDWWCFKMDADEVYIDDPKQFMLNVPDRYFFVASESIEYQLCIEDIAEYNFTDDFSRDVQNVRYYSPYAWSEKRFFRHKKNLKWPENCNMPVAIGFSYPKLIKLKHYQYRSPQQIQLRLDTRRQAGEAGFGGWDHAKQKYWREKLSKRNGMAYDLNDGTYQIKRIRNRFKQSFILYLIYIVKLLFISKCKHGNI